MPPPTETRTVRIAAELAEEKLRWLACFGWTLTRREDRPYAGDVLVEREITLRATAPPRFERVAVLHLARVPVPRLREVEIEFWHPTLVPPAVFSVLVLLRWAALVLPLLALQWIVLLHAVDHGSEAAVRVGILGFVAPIGAVWVLVIVAWVAGSLWVRRVQHDPEARARRLRGRQEWALRRAAGIRGA